MPSRCASSRLVSCHSPSWPSISRTRTRNGWPSAFSCSGLSSTSVSCNLPLPSARTALLHIEEPLSSRKLGCSSAIEDCSGSAAAGPDEAGRRVRARFVGERTPRGLGLRLAREQEQDLPRAAERRQSERHAVDDGFETSLRRQDALAPAQGRCVREQRRDVPVRAHSEQEQVELRVAEFVLVVGRGLVLAELSFDAVDRTRAVVEAVEEGSLRHAVVRVVMVGRDAPLVPPPELSLAPVGGSLCGFLVRLFGRLPACQYDMAALAGRAGEPLGDDRGDLLVVFDDDELDAAHNSPAASSLDRSIAAFLRNRLRRLLRRAGETMFPPRAPFLWFVRLAPRAAKVAAWSEDDKRGEPPAPPPTPPPPQWACVTTSPPQWSLRHNSPAASSLDRSIAA